MVNKMKTKESSSNDQWKKSGISHKFPSYRNYPIISIQGWMSGKQKEDEAEGLWRVHDNLYDLTDFINFHPGGSFWLKETKGTDITEAFESHHISLHPTKMLEKFKIRKASKPRNYKFTFKENGFFKVLKERVRERIKEMNYQPTQKTQLMHSALLLSLFMLSIASCLSESKILVALGGLSLCWLTNASHNYFHQKDNWRMYAFNFSLMNVNTWRVSHALSHHIYPNTFHDLEMSLFEPFLCWVPNPQIATTVQRCLSVITQPIFYAVIFPFHLIMRIIHSLRIENVMYWHDIIAFSLPVLMYFVTGAPLSLVLKQWLFIVLAGSFFFGIIGLNAAHHDPEIYHDGDALREDFDWGLFQVDTIIDRGDIKGSDFLVLTHFGEHILHHLFPTLDHTFLPKLYPEFQRTLKEFKTDLREINGLQHLLGQNKQLLRTTSNPNPPGYKKQN